MRRLLILLISLLLIFGSFTFCSCITTETTYNKIELTESNYDKYIAINIYFSDGVAVLTQDNKYDTACIGNVETSKRTDCIFEDVSILIKPSVSTLTYDFVSSVYLNLDINGNAHASFSCYANDKTLIRFPYAGKSAVVVSTISGYVLVPED
jgi:hypothetical protein